MAPRIITADEAREFVRQFEADEPDGLPWEMCPITYGFDCGVGPDDWRITRAGTEDRAVANIDATCDESVVRHIVRAANAHRDLAHTVIAQAEELTRLREIIKAHERVMRELRDAVVFCGASSDREVALFGVPLRAAHRGEPSDVSIVRAELAETRARIAALEATIAASETVEMLRAALPRDV